MITVVNKYKHTPTINDIYIGRGSVLGNPFVGTKNVNLTKGKYQCDSREESIESYERYLLEKINIRDTVICNELNRIYKISKSSNVNLVCFCSPKKCHGDIIKKILDQKLEHGKNYIRRNT